MEGMLTLKRLSHFANFIEVKWLQSLDAFSSKSKVVNAYSTMKCNWI